MRGFSPFLRFLAVVMVWGWTFCTSAHAESHVCWLDVEDIIGPISADYIGEAIHQAETDEAQLLVIRLDTPGGLMVSMRTIIKSILASRVPVCVYVGPEGAHAASAGTFILYSAHVAAMAPGTNLGAASPVSSGGEMDSTLASKAFEDAEAYIRSLARLRDRNEEWAASAVHSAKALPAEDALEAGVIDLMATGPEDLLSRINGRRTKVGEDSVYVINTGAAEIHYLGLSWRHRALAVLNNPTVAYLLLMLGFYGLFFELSNPGAVVPGVIGGISLILGLLGLQTMSLNYAGLLLIVLALGLFFLETQITSHGVLSLGGTAALLAGSLILFDSPEPFLRVSLKVILPVVLLTASFMFFAVTMALRAQKRKIVSGAESLVGLTAEVRTPLDPVGQVFVAGEHWSAQSETGETIAPGDTVMVTSVDHLKLSVRKNLPEEA